MKCVYCLEFPDGKRYVGSTADLKKRLHGHNYSSVNKNSAELKAAILNGYEVVILEQCPDNYTRKQLEARETHYIGLWWDYGILYNMRKSARGGSKKGHGKGKKMPEEAKARIGAANKHPGWNNSAEIKALRATGLSYNKIAERYNCSGDTIRLICLS